MMVFTLNGNAENVVSVKHIDDNVEVIAVDFPSTLCFYAAKRADSKNIKIFVEDELDKDIVYNDISFKMKGNELVIKLDGYHPEDSTRFNDPNKIKIYIPFQFLDKTTTKYISFRKNDNGEAN